MANHKLDTDTQVFFYEQDFYVLSNFSAFAVEWAGFVFLTAEHAYHWMKFHHDDHKYQCSIILRQIENARSAHEAFKIGQKYSEFRHPNWADIRVETMEQILWTKLAQHEYVHRKLLATGDRELIEDSWRDDFWGWGPNRDGQNMLGKLWMQIRAQLRGGK